MNNHQFDSYYFHNDINSYCAATVLSKMNRNIVLGISTEKFQVDRNKQMSPIAKTSKLAYMYFYPKTHKITRKLFFV